MNKKALLFPCILLLSKSDGMEVRIVNERIRVINKEICIEGDFNGDVSELEAAAADDFNAQSWQSKQKASKRLEVAELSTIIVENTVGKIDVVGEERTNLKLRISKLGETKDDLENINAEISHEGNSLHIKTMYLKPAVHALIKYKLAVPKDKSLEFNLTTSSGATSVKTIMGQVKAKTVSGHAKLCEVVGSSTIETKSGDIEISSIQGDSVVKSIGGKAKANEIIGNLEIQTISGDIEAAAITGKVKIKTVGGSISLRKNAINSPVTIKTTSGNVKLYTDTFNGNLEAKTISGKFESDFSNMIPKQRPAGIEISIQVGLGGPSIKLSSVSGNIKLIKN